MYAEAVVVGMAQVGMRYNELGMNICVVCVVECHVSEWLLDWNVDLLS